MKFFKYFISPDDGFFKKDETFCNIIQSNIFEILISILYPYIY